MALIDKASLLMVPSTYEAGKLYNVLPSGNRAPDNKGGAGYDQTRADFDFDRGSNAAATRINSSGLIEKYRENVLLQSNSLNTSPWVKLDGATLVSGQSGYDGSSDAWRINITNSANSGLYQAISLNGVYSYSIYAKAGDINYLGFTNFAGSSYDIFFNLSNGTIANQSGFIDATITIAGNGFYRCTLTSVNPVYLQMKPSSTASNTSTAGYIFLQDLQAETGLVATEFLNSTSVTAKAGVLVDLPRINYDTNGENGALLLEPSRQQLIQYSEYFGGWDLSNSTITNNATTSPEGVDNASLYTSSNATNHVKDIITAANGTYTLSAFFKRDATDNVQMNLSDGVTGEIRYVFNLADETSTLTKSGGTISGYSADFENYGNGWYRLHITATTNSGTAITAYFETDNETGSFYVFGAQLESNASYVSSYIPNHGTTGGVTRAADSCSVTGASDVIPNEGVFYAELNALDDDNTNRVFTLNDGSTANRVQMYFNTSNQIVGGISAAGSGQANIEYTIDIKSFLKVAFKYKTNDFALWVNGVEVATSTDVAEFVPNILSELSFDRGDNTYPFFGNTKGLKVYPKALADVQLEDLTTI